MSKPILDYTNNIYQHIGKKVFVYWNLHKNLWSVKDLKTGKVIGHAPLIYLRECQYKVSESGRQRVLREKRKNVHAGVKGYLSYNLLRHCNRVGRFTYNPYKYKNFVDVRSKQALFNSEHCVLSTSKFDNKNRPITLWGNNE